MATGDAENIVEKTIATENQVYTGFFKDGERRIDLVLVTQDDGNSKADAMRTTFLMNAVKLGLELEIEPGMSRKHKDLLFVKVHAPDELIEEQGDAFRIRKHFKETHVQFVNPGNRVIKYMKAFAPFLFNNSEKEWIKITRKQYPGPMNYSTLERSYIVYRIFLVLPFGNYENYLGLQRLLDHKIILDAYALHDGPYFFVPSQNVGYKVNGRQILYSNWVGLMNFFKLQPVSMIEEYLGEKIAFYFAYLEYFIIALIIPVAAGCILSYSSLSEIFNRNMEYHASNMRGAFCVKNFMHHLNVKHYAMCPKCKSFKACQFVRWVDHCAEVTLKYVLTSDIMMPYYMLLPSWTLLFALLWGRKETYLRWLWECDIDALKYIFRPDYKFYFKKVTKSSRTGMWTTNECFVLRLIKFIFAAAIILACVAAVVPMTIIWANLYFYILMKNVNYAKLDLYAKSQYRSLLIISGLYVGLIIVLETTYTILSRLLTGIENHKAQDTYERSLIAKMFGLSLISSFWYIIFLAFYKGRTYTHPVDPQSWKSFAGLSMMNCGLFNCMDELAILVVVFIIGKYVAFNGIFYWLPMKSDYEQGIFVSHRVPCWEREYLLKPITEQYMRDTLLDLVMQLAVISFFGGAFGPIVLIILLVNIWEIRYKARLFLVGRRRPLLHRSSGIGTWATCILIIAYISVIANSLMIGMNTRSTHTKLKTMMKVKTAVNVYSTHFFISYYRNASAKQSDVQKIFNKHKFKLLPSYTCKFPSKFRRYNKTYEATAEHWMVKYNQLYAAVYAQIMCLIIFSILKLTFPTDLKDISETTTMEKQIIRESYKLKKIPPKKPVPESPPPLKSEEPNKVTEVPTKLALEQK